MINNRNTLKKNQPELLVDFNGNAVQHAWMLGGKTIKVTDGGTFTCESTLMRVCNAGATLITLKLDNADYSELPNTNVGLVDQGFPVLPNSTEYVGVYNQGQVYLVSGGDLYVTFVFDRRTPIQ